MKTIGIQQHKILRQAPPRFQTEELQLIQDLIKPENHTERSILQHPEWVEGALWGEPRWGHPEGSVILHIREVLDNVDKASALFPHFRAPLRLITILHDTFKYKEEQARPRLDWSKHHAVFAADFAKMFIKNKKIVDIIELHDEAYYAWVNAHFHDDPIQAQHRLKKIQERVENELQLYYLFFKCDTQTGDKTQMPMDWFEEIMVPKIEVVRF